MKFDALMEHVEDSLRGGEFLAKNIPRMADIGSGGGLPGIPLAIKNPDIEFSLIESCRKKCSFLRMVKSQLGLKNLLIFNNRIEHLGLFDCLISRAAFSPDDLNLLSGALVPSGSLFLWSTTKIMGQQISSLKSLGCELVESHNYSLSNGKSRVVLEFKNVPRGTKEIKR